ncbi:MAG: transporter substrate-binding domain-containing protein [Oscillospiraceae bacterium]
MQVFGVNWDQKLVQLDAKECDCVWSGMTILDSMKDAGYVLSAPYYDNTQVIMVKEGSDIKSSADLAGKVVAVQLGTSGDALLTEGGDLEDLAATFASPDPPATASSSASLSWAAAPWTPSSWTSLLLPPMPSKNAGFTILCEELGAEQYGIAFRADDKELCSSIEGAVKTSWWTTAPMPRSPRSIPTSSIT